MECGYVGRAKEANGKVYDFGGAVASFHVASHMAEIHDFKLQYGGQLANYGRYTRIHKKMMYRIGEFGIEDDKEIIENNS